LLAAAAGPVEDHDGIVDFARRVSVRLPERRIMHVETWQRFTRPESEVS
jgi:hypothetical protein